MSANDVQTPPDSRQWFVRMVAGGAVFGPIRTNGLVLWAAEGRVMPDDEISEDKVHWIPAQELPELCMDTLIAHPNGSFIGPFHRDALQALIREGKIPPDAQPFPKSELSQRLAARQMSLFGDDAVSAVPESAKPHRKKSPPANDGDSAAIAQLRKELDEAKAQCTAAESDAAAARDAAAQASTELAVAIAERDAFQKKLAAAESGVAATAREAAGKASAERDTAIAERDSLQEKLAAAESSAATAREAAAKASAERAAAIAERDALQEKLAAAESGATAAREVAETASAERDAAIAERDAFQAKLDAASAELASVLAARDAAESDADTAREASTKAAKERDGAVAEMIAAKADRDAAKSEAAAARDASAKAAEERDALQMKLEESQRELSELLEFSNARDADYQKTIGDLENSVSELRNRFAENDNSAQAETVLRSRLHEREMDILCLARQLATASESAREREAALLKRIEDLEGGYGSLPL